MFKILFISLICLSAKAQNDSIFIRNIYNTALSKGESYENLRSLCKDIGNRLSGSAGAKMAVDWSKQKMESYHFDKVYLQAIMVPHWERGTPEKGWIRTEKGEIIKVHLLALGGSVGTSGLMEAEVIEFKTLKALMNANTSLVKDKIVFINEPMNEDLVNTLEAYGNAYPVRGNGASESAKLGAKAVIIRSLGLPIDIYPHTGTMHYQDSIQKIPAAAISTFDAEKLSQILKTQKANFVFEMDCKWFDPAPSFNVIAEITGSKYPNQIITVGGHLDSWDTAEGAHDDGAGVMHSLEALRILKVLNYKPLHTIRVVFFMNEENGNQGGETYATWVKEKGEEHIAAIESDLGGFVPRGFECDGSDDDVSFLQSLAPKLKQYQLHIFEKGHSGVDVSPLKNQFPNIALFGFLPDSQRYFDIHHSPNDVFENVNKRELELGCAAIASLLYYIDQRP